MSRRVRHRPAPPVDYFTLDQGLSFAEGHGSVMGSLDRFSPSTGLLSTAMDYSKLWPETTFQAELEDLNLLEPPATFQAAPSGANQAPTMAGPASSSEAALFGLQAELRPSVEEEDRRKRSREAIERESLETFLRELGKEPEDAPSEPQPSSSGDEKRARQPVDAAAAARAKAGRERARRERLNESFLELSKVLEPGKAVKTDKTSTIADAIRIVTQLRAENGQLRQLNKFLEERTQNMEKLKCELALQLQLIQQQQQGGAAPGPSGHMQPGGMMPHYMSGPGMGLAMGSGGAMGMGQHFSGMMHPMQMQGVQMQGMQMQGIHSMGYVPQQMSAAAAPLQSGETAAAHSSAGTSQAPPGEIAKVEPGASTSIGTGGKGLAGAVAAGFVSHSDAPAFPVGPAGFMSAAEVDTSLDSTRRPPAA